MAPPPRDVLKFLLRSTKRVVILVIGAALVVGGAAMLVLPGPGLLVIIAGLAVLATEFAWAAVLLDRAKEKAAQAGQAAKRRFARKRSGEQEPREPATDDRQTD
ncbi:MAG: PGPGW domain-containing protein [Acidimicrobiales bacterium]